MLKLEIHESLIPYIQKITNKKELDSTNFDDRSIIKQINAAYQDCFNFAPTINTFRFITYNIVRKFYQLPFFDKHTIDKNIETILNDYNIRRKLHQINPKSEFFSVIKDIIPYYLEFKESLVSNNGYMVISSYEKIVKLLENETLAKYPANDLDLECRKRYNYPYDNAKGYAVRMKTKYYSKKPFKLGELRCKTFYSNTCELLAHFFHNQMIKYYKQTGYYYSPINDDLSFYIINGKNIVGYKYDDEISMSIDGYKWERYEFWALLNMQDKPKIKIDTSKIKKDVNYDGTYIIAPNDLIEEALITNLMKEKHKRKFTPEFIEYLKEVGIPNEYYPIKALTTYDGNNYFLCPNNYDSLKIKDFTNLSTLDIIKRKNPENRDKYIAKLISTYKGKHREEVDKKQEKDVKKRTCQY